MLSFRLIFFLLFRKVLLSLGIMRIVFLWVLFILVEEVIGGLGLVIFLGG